MPEHKGHTTVISNVFAIMPYSWSEFGNNHWLPPPFREDEDGVKNAVGYLHHNHFLPLPRLSSLLTEYYFCSKHQGSYACGKWAPPQLWGESCWIQDINAKCNPLCQQQGWCQLCNETLAERHTQSLIGTFQERSFSLGCLRLPASGICRTKKQLSWDHETQNPKMKSAP